VFLCGRGACWLRFREEEMQSAKGWAAASFVFRECYFMFKIRKNIIFILVFFLKC